jgi:hypothetical protein
MGKCKCAKRDSLAICETDEPPRSTLLSHTPDDADGPLRRDSGRSAAALQRARSATFGHSCLKKLASGMAGLKAQQTLLVVATAMKNSTKETLEVR